MTRGKDEPATLGRAGLVLLIAGVWITSARVLAEHGWRLLPRELLQQLTLQSYLTLVQVVALGLGLGLTFTLLRRASIELGWTRPSSAALVSAALLAPAAYVATAFVAWQLALPTLKLELAQRGLAQVQQSSGEFGLQLRQSPLWLAVVWGVLVSPIAEELCFRGPLWSGVQRVVEVFTPARRERAPAGDDETEGLASSFLVEDPLLRAARAVGSALSGGGVATLVSAAIFGALHAGVPGGMGIARVTSAVGLGLACGFARQRTGAVWAALVVHVVFNALSLAGARGWLRLWGLGKLGGVHAFALVLAASLGVVWLGATLIRAGSRARPTP